MTTWRDAVLAAAVAGLVVGACGDSGDDVELSVAGERGRAVADRVGCTGCHGGPGGDATVGPSWVESWGAEIDLADGTSAVFDEAYVVASVRTPQAARRRDARLTMPAFADDQVTDDELADLVAYLRDLGGEP